MRVVRRGCEGRLRAAGSLTHWCQRRLTLEQGTTYGAEKISKKMLVTFVNADYWHRNAWKTVNQLTCRHLNPGGITCALFVIPWTLYLDRTDTVHHLLFIQQTTTDNLCGLMQLEWLICPNHSSCTCTEAGSQRDSAAMENRGSWEAPGAYFACWILICRRQTLLLLEDLKSTRTFYCHDLP